MALTDSHAIEVEPAVKHGHKKANQNGEEQGVAGCGGGESCHGQKLILSHIRKGSRICREQITDIVYELRNGKNGAVLNQILDSFQDQGDTKYQHTHEQRGYLGLAQNTFGFPLNFYTIDHDFYPPEKNGGIFLHSERIIAEVKQKSKRPKNEFLS